MSEKRDLSLEGLRGLACLAVFSCHFLYVFFPYLALGRTVEHAAFLPNWPWETWFARPPFTLLYNGDFAVSVFFVLSGYVLTQKYWRSGDASSLAAGALKRYPRLIIPAAASIGVALLLMRLRLIYAHQLPDPSFAGWVRDLYTQVPSIRAAAFAGFVGVPFRGDPATLAWNGPLWTLAIEFWGSIALFACFALFSRQKLIAVLSFTLWAFIGGSAVYYMPFVIGASLNGATGWLRNHRRVAMVLFAVGLSFGSYDYTDIFYWLTEIAPIGVDRRAFWYVFGATFLVAGVIGSERLRSFFGSIVIAYLGRISFSLYLLHWPIIFSFSIWAVQRYEAMGLSYVTASWVTLLTSAALLIVLSEAFYRLVDQPAMRLANTIANFALGNKMGLPNRESNRADGQNELDALNTRIQTGNEMGSQGRLQNFDVRRAKVVDFQLGQG